MVGQKEGDKTMDGVRFGQFVAQQRRARGLTQKQLGGAVGVTDKAVSKWERGLSLPDVALLEPLARQLEVSVTELLRGERLPQPDLRAEAAVGDALSLSKRELGRRRRRQRALLAVSGALLLAAVTLAVLFYQTCIAPYPQSLDYLAPPAGWSAGDTAQWEALFPAHSAYALGLDQQGRPVFQDPGAALRKCKGDCSDAAAYLRREHHLLPLSRFTLQGYGTYGWQTGSGDERIDRQGKMLTAFWDIYQNSYA